ncbi:hypothetical protein [Tenacibaculum sp.]|uniref:hypothetical protein n=1 Tax=Tenacibaculum sp. TaxID=1906242 RepID=UPI003D148676
MERICGIYKITSPSGKIYIGKSKNIKRRWYQYKSLHCKTQPKLYNSFKKYCVENHCFEILKECIEEELSVLELYFIKMYDSINNNKGLNCDMSDESKLISYKLEHNYKRLEKEKKEKTNKRRRELYRLKKENIKPLTDEYLRTMNLSLGEDFELF